MKLTKTGRNDIWPLVIVLATDLSLILLFYSARYYYKREKANLEVEVINDEDEALRSKLSQRLNSLDAFRG